MLNRRNLRIHIWVFLAPFAKALPLLQKAANAGNTEAMYNLGYLYELGQGVAQDFGKAYEWYQKAANAGDTDAKKALENLPSQ